MLATVFRDWPENPGDTCPDVLIATSLNGIRGLERAPMLTRWLSLPLYVPGAASAAYGRNVGFSDVRPVHGDAVAIGAQVLAEVPDGARILYVAGADRSGALDDRLREAGYNVDLVEIYLAAPVERLPDLVISALRGCEIDRILVFSARTASALLTCLRASDLLPLSRGIHIHAISQQAAMPLIDAGFASIVLARRPDAAELLDTLEAEQ
jgi:uroporphyrinogen-III synthase